MWPACWVVKIAEYESLGEQVIHNYHIVAHGDSDGMVFEPCDDLQDRVPQLRCRDIALIGQCTGVRMCDAGGTKVIKNVVCVGPELDLPIALSVNRNTMTSSSRLLVVIVFINVDNAIQDHSLHPVGEHGSESGSQNGSV